MTSFTPSPFFPVNFPVLLVLGSLSYAKRTSLSFVLNTIPPSTSGVHVPSGKRQRDEKCKNRNEQFKNQTQRTQSLTSSVVLV